MPSKTASTTEHLNWEPLREDGNTGEMERFCNVPIIAPKTLWIWPCVAVILQVIVALLLAIVAFVGIWIQHNAETVTQQPISTAVRLIYVTGITILATLISTFTAGQIRTLWLRDVLESLGPGDVTLHQRRHTTDLVGQAGLTNMARTWRISVTFLITGLITTTIVAGLSFQNDNCKCHIPRDTRSSAHPRRRYSDIQHLSLNPICV